MSFFDPDVELEIEFSRLLARLWRRCPTFSVLLSVQERSALNIVARRLRTRAACTDYELVVWSRPDIVGQNHAEAAAQDSGMAREMAKLCEDGCERDELR